MRVGGRRHAGPHAEGLSGTQLRFEQISLVKTPGWGAQIVADSCLPCGLGSSGSVVPFRGATERDRYPTAAWGQPLNRAQLERELPGLAPQWSTGLLFAQDGQIDNLRLLMGPSKAPAPTAACASKRA